MMAHNIPAILHILWSATRSWNVQVSAPVGPLEDPVHEAPTNPLMSRLPADSSLAPPSQQEDISRSDGESRRLRLSGQRGENGGGAD